MGSQGKRPLGHRQGTKTRKKSVKVHGGKTYCLGNGEPPKHLLPKPLGQKKLRPSKGEGGLSMKFTDGKRWRSKVS